MERNSEFFRNFYFSEKIKIFIFTTLLWMSPTTWAYNFTSDFVLGFYWQSFPIHMTRVFVDHEEGNQLIPIIEQAKAEWESIVGQELWSFGQDIYSDGPVSGNLIRWSNNFEEETGFDGTYTLAVAIRYSQGPYFVKTEIIINGSNQMLRNNVSNALYKTVLHELGHTLGIDHSETEAIMAPYLGQIDYLTEDDQQAVSRLVSETQYRQSTGFVSSLLSSDDTSGTNKLATCGSLDVNSGGPGNGGSQSFLVSLFLGILMVVLISYSRKGVLLLRS